MFWKKRKRLLFRYWDGQRDRRGDPVAMFRKLVSHPTFRLDMHPRLVDEGDEESIEETIQATCDVCGVSRWSEESPGLTQMELLELFTAFCDYVAGLKKNIVFGSIRSPATAESTSSDSSGEITNDSAPSGSPSNGQKSEKPTESAVP